MGVCDKLKEFKRNLEIAENHFNWAVEDDAIDSAIKEYNTALEEYNNYKKGIGE